jgi:PAS domain S-box-containing protein
MRASTHGEGEAVMTKKKKRAASLQHTQRIAELQRENEQLKAKPAEREKTEGALRQSQELLRAFMDSATDAFTIYDSHLTLVDVNETALRYLGPGVRREDVIGKNLADFTTDPERHIPYLKVMETGEPFVAEDTLVLPVAGEFTVMTRAFRVGNGLGIVTSDITARKRMENEARRSEERYRLLADNASDVIWVADMDLNLTYVSPSAARILGCSKDELMAPLVRDLLLPEPVRLRIQAFREQISSGPQLLGCSARELTLETRLRLRDGSVIWVEDKINFIHDAANRLTGVMGITREITDRKEAEEELRSSEERSRLLLDNANEGIAVVQNGVVKFANPKLAELSGYSREDLISKPFSQLIHSDDLPLVMDYYARRLKGDRLSEVFTARFVDKAGATRWGEVNAVLIDWDGEPAVLAMINDTTERRRDQEILLASEEKFRALAEGSIQGIAISQGVPPRFVYCNRALADMAGYTVDEFLSMTAEQVVNFVYADDQAVFFKRFIDLLEGLPSEGHYEFRALRRDGAVLWLESFSSVVQYQGQPAVQSSLVDITKRKLVEDSLRESEDRFRLLFERSAEAQLLLDHEGKVVDCNDAMLRLFALSDKKEIVGHDPEEFAPEFQPDGTPSSDMGTTILAAVLEKGSAQLEWTHLKHDPQRTPIMNELICTLIPIQGRPFLHVAIRDITERKLAEDSLLESEKRYRLIADNSSDVIWTMDMNLRMTYVSPSNEKLTGYSAEESMSMKMEDGLTPASLETATRTFSQGLVNLDRNSGKPTSPVAVELEMKRKDGSTVWTEVKMTFMQDSEGKVVGIMGIARNIDERRRARKAMEESEKRYRLIAENSSDVIWTMDMNLRNTYISPSIVRLTGFSLEEAASMGIGDGLTPASLEAATQSYLEAMKALERNEAPPGGATRVEVEMYRRDGSTVWAEVETSFMRDSEGKVVGIMGIARNIDERRRARKALEESEKRYRLIAENSTDVIWTMDMNLRNTYLSPSIVSLTGFSFEEAASMGIGDGLTPASLEVATQHYLVGMKALERNERIPGFASRMELEMYRKDGSTVWTEVETTFMEDSEGKVVGIMGTARNIDERRRAEQALRERLKELQCIVGISRLAEKPELPIEDLVQGAVSLLPSAWQYPEICGARIALDSKEFKTANYRETEWSQSADIKMDGKSHGAVTVCYLEEKPVADEGPFIKEERDLIDTVADFLGHVIQHRLTEESLRASEERYRLLAENVNDVIWTLDLNLRYTYMSPSITRLTGYKVEEYLAQSLEETLTTASYDTVSKIALEELVVEEGGGGDTDRSRIVEAELKCKDGSAVWVEVQATFLRDARGKAMGILGVSRDISERKRAEEDLQRAHAELEARVEQRTAELRETNSLLIQEIGRRQQVQERLQESESRYRDLVENANSVILELDIRGKVSFFNRFAQEFFGFTEEEIVGRHVVGTIAPPVDSEGKDSKALIRELIKHPEEHFVTESEGVRRNGERVWISWTNKGLYDAKGRLRKVLCIGMDRTEQKRVAEMLAEQEKDKAAVAERQRLARDLHDVVTQTLFSASLIAEVLPRLWEKDHAEGERRLEELRRLTRGALAEMRMLLLELRPAALGEVGLADLLRQLGEATTGRTTLPVTLSIRGKCTAPLDVQVALYRVAQEALNNVVKHSGATKAGIRLYCRENSADLTVSDNGSGFDIQAVSPKSLGLRIMRERVEAVGAKLKIESQAGQGTKVGVLWSGATRKGGS